MGVSERSRKTMKRKVRAVSAKEEAHADHARHAAVRPLILPTPRPSFLAPSVTIPVYRKFTCQMLRKPLRGSYCEPRRAESPKIDLPRSLSDVCSYLLLSVVLCLDILMNSEADLEILSKRSDLGKSRIWLKSW